LGENAIKVHAFCLPGKENEVRNSAMMLARALDTFTERFQSYAFGNSYKLAFVEDLECDTAHAASFSICSSRLLFPETVWEPLEHTTRVLVHAVASQWIGVDVIAHNPEDHWIVVGGSWFMAELYLRELFGRNDWRFRQKLMVDKVIQMDRKRPSLQQLGEHLQLDPGDMEFMELKSLMVLSILHNRLVKQSGKNGVDRCLYRMLFNARQGKYPQSAITTDDFLDICEKVGHQKLESFFQQWVVGSGCPTFHCVPSFNKKKQVVQLTIKQLQADSSITNIEGGLAADDFMREAKEKSRDMRSATGYPTFVGPMTIRIHEADGTPYEHIVDINSNNVKVEIPYNTKYKRLKRNRLNKERQAAAAGFDASGEAQEDVTFYMLGDLFTTPQEHEEWRLDDWPPEDEAKQEGEAYEWIRVDADFEWICRTNIEDMPSYMYVSQLQQDKDVVAQAESIQFLANKEGHRLISTFLVKTLMDNRYFHGIRTMAAMVLAQSALKRTEWVGLFHLKKTFRELFCLPNSPLTRPNDFSDRSMYLLQCAIPKAIARIKGEDGRSPLEAKQFLLDLVRYNDNRGNDYSDDHYMSTLMRCLAETLTSSKSNSGAELGHEEWVQEQEFTSKAIGELTRHQRLDEWIPTYQNVYTTTALDCALKLVMSRVTPFKPTEFLQYAQLGNADNVRLRAWECLIRLGMIRKDTVLRFLVHEIRSDPSPYFRKQLLRILGIAIGQIATGDVWAPEKTVETSADTLVVDNEASNNERASALARQNLNGALRGLKQDLQGHRTLRMVLEEALKSTVLSTSDMSELLDICHMIFDNQKVNKLSIKLQLPRYWTVNNLGKGVLQFKHTKKFRWKPKGPITAEVPAPAPPSQPAKGPTAPAARPTTGLPKLSLKFGNKNKSATSPPPTADARSRQQSMVFSPAVQHSPATFHSPSPAPLSTRVSPAPPLVSAEPAKTESRSSTPDVPLMQPPKKAQTPAATPAATPKTATPAPAPAPAPVTKTPVPLPKIPTPAPAPTAARPTPAPVNIPRTVATPPAIASPIPLPAPKLKIRTKTSSGTTVPSRPASAAPSPRPSAAPSPLPPPSRPAAAPSSTSTPKPVAKRRSKIVKLRLPPHQLSKFTKKRKLVLGNGDEERAAKRQSTEPGGGNGGGGEKSGLVSVERGTPERPRLLLKMRVGRAGLP
jgi:transcription initiation factor TFIID subunit 2